MLIGSSSTMAIFAAARGSARGGAPEADGSVQRRAGPGLHGDVCGIGFGAKHLLLLGCFESYRVVTRHLAPCRRPLRIDLTSTAVGSAPPDRISCLSECRRVLGILSPYVGALAEPTQSLLLFVTCASRPLMRSDGLGQFKNSQSVRNFTCDHGPARHGRVRPSSTRAGRLAVKLQPAAPLFVRRDAGGPRWRR